MSALKGFRLNQEAIVFLAAVGIFIAFSLTLPSFLAAQNLLTLVRSVSVLGMMGLGMAIVVIGRGIDVAMIATMAVSVCLGLLLANTTPMGLFLSLGVGLLFAIAVGLLIGWLIAYADVPAIFASLAMASVVYGVGRQFFFVLDIQNAPSGVPWFDAIGRGSLLGIPTPILAFALLALVAHVFLTKTRMGLFIYSIGDNPLAARTSGLQVRPILVAQYVLSSVAAYMAGLVMASSVSGMNLRIYNSTMIYDILLVVVLGGIGLSGGQGRVRNVIVGTIFVGLLINGMTIMNFDYTEQNLIKSVILLLAIVIDALLNPRDEQTAQQGDI